MQDRANDEERRNAAVAKLREEDGIGDAHGIALDVTDSATIADAARQIEAEFGRLDVLINNAGIAADSSPPSQTDIAKMRQTFDINLFGVVEVTNALLSLLHKSDAPRIVNVSSGLGSLAQNADPTWEYARINVVAYNASKAALNMFTVALAKEMAGTPFKINSADPGYTMTDLNNTGHRTVEQGATIIVQLAMLGADGPTGGYFDEKGTIPW